MISVLATLALLQAASAPIGASNTQMSEGQRPDSQQQAQATQQAQQRPVMICRSERLVGSNRTRRVCATDVQRDDARASAERALEAARDRSAPDGDVPNS